MTDKTDRQLAAQYEAYPYPARDPREEAKRLVVGSPSHLREVDHWIFGGRRPASRPLAALMAGGGSGDGTVMLAQQMTSLGRPGRVTWLDRSAQARKVASARVAARRLDNVGFEEGSILDLPGSGLGPFDYIDCCGVLHHLPDPAAGLAALVGVLAPGGGIGLMVYAPHGRTGVYMMQDALRLLAPPAEDPAARVDVAKRVWKQAPETAWLRKNPWIDDHIRGGDAGLYDLLLNPRDVAFTVPRLAALVAGAGLRIACLVEPARYDPDLWLTDPKLRARTAGLDAVARAALTEALCGNMGIHIAYCVRADDPVVAPPWEDAATIPVLREIDGAKLAQAVQGGVLPVGWDGLRAALPMPPLAGALAKRIDGKKNWAEITADLVAAGASAEQVARDRAALVATMEKMNRLLVAAPA